MNDRSRPGIGLAWRLGLALTLLFGVTALLLLPWIDRTTRTAAEETLQQVNREVARAVVEHADLFADGAPVEKEIQGVFMKLMGREPEPSSSICSTQTAQDPRVRCAREGIVQAWSGSTSTPVEEPSSLGAEGVVRGTGSAPSPAPRGFSRSGRWTARTPAATATSTRWSAATPTARWPTASTRCKSVTARRCWLAGGVLALAALCRARHRAC